MMVLLLTRLAAAQSGPSTPTAQLNADPFRPTLDPGSLLATESAMVPEQIITRADLAWVHNPLTWEKNTTAQADIVGDALGLHLSGGLGLGRARLGATALLLQLQRSDVHNVPTKMAGDFTLSGKLSVIEGERLRLAAIGGGTAPLGASTYHLGHTGISGDIGLAVGAGTTLRSLLNLGYRFQPQTTLDVIEGDLILGNSILLRGGGAWAPTPQLTVTGELSAQVYTSAPESTPAEIMLGASRQSTAGRILRGGIGVGIYSGIGAPTWRLMLGVGHDPSAVQIEPSPLPIEPAAPAEIQTEDAPTEDASEDAPTEDAPEDAPTEDAPSPG